MEVEVHAHGQIGIALRKVGTHEPRNVTRSSRIVRIDEGVSSGHCPVGGAVTRWARSWDSTASSLPMIEKIS